MVLFACLPGVLVAGTLAIVSNKLFVDRCTSKCETLNSLSVSQINSAFASFFKPLNDSSVNGNAFNVKSVDAQGEGAEAGDRC